MDDMKSKISSLITANTRFMRRSEINTECTKANNEFFKELNKLDKRLNELYKPNENKRKSNGANIETRNNERINQEKEIKENLIKAYKKAILTNTKHAKTPTSITTIANLKDIFNALHNTLNKHDKEAIFKMIIQVNNELFEISETWKINESKKENIPSETWKINEGEKENKLSIKSEDEHILNKNYDYYDFLKEENRLLENEVKEDYLKKHKNVRFNLEENKFYSDTSDKKRNYGDQ